MLYTSINILIFISLLYSILKIKDNPTLLFSLYFSFIFLYTALGYDFFSYAKKVPFENQLLSISSIEEAGIAFTIAIYCFILGSFFGKKNYTWNRKATNHNLSMQKQQEKKLNINNLISMTFILLTVVISVLAFDMKQIFFRNSYIIDSIHTLEILFKIMTPIAFFLCAFVNPKIIRYVFIIILLIIPFSLNSRILSLSILMLFLGLHFKNGSTSLGTKVFFSLILVSSFITATLLRSLPNQGLIPNLSGLLTLNPNFDDLYYSINYVTSYSVFSTQYAIENTIGNINTFLISINPLPSSLINIESFASEAMINTFSPAPSIAILYNQGYIISILYYSISGFIFSKILNNTKKEKIFPILYSVFALFIFLNSQYLLRESTRLIYYIVLLYILVRLLKKLNFHK